MESKNMIGGIVSLAIVIICAATLLMPIISDVTAPTETITNEGVPFVLADSTDTDTHTLIIGPDTDGNPTITLDGEDCEIPNTSLYGSATILFAQNSILRYESSGAVRIYGNNGSSPYASTLVGAANTHTVTVAITGTTAAISSTYTESTYTISNVQAYIADEGTYVLAENPYVLEDSEIYIGAYNVFSGSGAAFAVYGEIDNYTGVGLYPSGRAIGTVTTNLTNVESELNIVDSIEIQVLDGDTEIGTMTVTYFLAPLSLTYTNAEYDSNYAPLYSAIPIMVIVGIVVASIGLIATRRD